MRQYVIICAFFLVISGINGAKYPKDLPKCNSGDTNCLKKVIPEVIQKIKNGRPDMNVMSIDPLHVNALDILQGTDSPLAISLNFRNLDLYGITDASINDIQGFDKDPKTSKFELKIFVPRLVILADYKVDGRVLILPVQGNGKSNLTLDNLALNIKFKPQVTTKNGKNYIATDKFNFNFDTTRLYLRFENLFNGDKALGENMNLFINENWMDILGELKPGITEAFSQILGNLIDAIFKKISYDDIFL